MTKAEKNQNTAKEQHAVSKEEWRDKLSPEQYHGAKVPTGCSTARKA